MAIKAVLKISDDLVICKACGTQYPETDKSKKDSCKICDDPRQFVPPTGQAFTTLAQLKSEGYRNVWWQDEVSPDIWSVKTEPQCGIGNRAMLIRTKSGNVLWDLIPYLDQETVDKINDSGGLAAIIISHPHYYSTWADWAQTFTCPIYIGAPDALWLERRATPNTDLRLLTETSTPILPETLDGITAILAGGHFPGSLLLHWQNNLFIADTIFSSPSALNPSPGLPGVISFTMWYSIPNRIPLHPDEILAIWKKVKPVEFETCFGAFKGQDVRTMPGERERGTGGVKGRLLESCKIFVRGTGWREGQHAIFEEEL